MDVSVIVCTSGRESLEKCLNSLEKQTVKTQNIVVSYRDLSNRLENFKVDKFIKTEGKGLSKDRNKGVKEADGKIVAFIDDDAEAEETWLESLIRHYEDPEVMCTGGKIVPEFQYEIPKEVSELDKYLLYGLVGATFIEWKEPGEIRSPLLWGCNLSFRKEVFDEIGYFPEELGRKGDKLVGEEDRYLQLKILENGYKIIYDPEAVVRHFISEEEIRKEFLLKKSFWQGISEIRRLGLSDDFTTKIEAMAKTSRKLAKYKLQEKMFKLYSINSLKEKIDEMRKIGRLTEIVRLTD